MPKLTHGNSGNDRLWPLWARLFSTVLMIIILLAFLVGVFTRHYLHANYTRGLEEKNENSFSAFTASLLEPVISEDIAFLETIVREITTQQPDIVALRITNESDTTLVAWQAPTAWNKQALLNFEEDIRFEEETFGKVSIDWSTASLNQEVERQVTEIRLLLGASLLILTFAGLASVHRLVIRPLAAIRRRILDLAKGDLSSRVHIDSSRELSLIAAATNNLADALSLQNQREQELEQAKTELFEAKELAEVTLHSIADGVITTDLEARIRYINPVTESLTGWSREELVGRPVDSVFTAYDEHSRKPAESLIHDCLREDQTVKSQFDVLLINRTGIEYSIESSASPIRTKQGDMIGAVLVFHDVTEARNLARKISYQADHDALTGLLNRAEFIRRLERSLHESTQRDTQHSLLYLDLDQFKVINDTCGHAAGDAYLQQLSPILKTQLRKGDSFARLGGDEFGIILSECLGANAIKVAEGLRDTVQQFRFVWQDKCFSVSVCIGITTINARAKNAEVLLSNADQACYAAKDSGRNRIHVVGENDSHLEQRRGQLNWLTEIRSALDQDRFVLHCQQILPLGHRQSDGLHYEILVRMQDHDGRLLPPGAFIPAAERYNMMSSLDRWVLINTLQQLSRHPQHLQNLQLCCINLSGNTLTDKDFLEEVERSLTATQIPPEKICFEITETTAIANLAAALQIIRHLKKLGCKLALDDFGSGMSSFGYLKHMPVDILKIDGTFIKDILTSDTNLAFVKSINEIGHVMGKQTIAEFVENQPVLEKLREINVDYVQGYGIAKPTPYSDLLTLKHPKPVSF